MKKGSLKKVVAIITVLLLLASFSGCIETEPGKETYNTTTTTATEKKEENFSLNETAVFSTLKITATELKESTGSMYFEPEAGNVFVGVKFTIENISEEEQSISSLLLFDAYADDVLCDLSITANAAFDGDTVDGTIASGKKMVGWYAMEVPKDWKTVELQVKADWLSNTSAKFIFTK